MDLGAEPIIFILTRKFNSFKPLEHHLHTIGRLGEHGLHRGANLDLAVILKFLMFVTNFPQFIDNILVVRCFTDGLLDRKFCFSAFLKELFGTHLTFLIYEPRLIWWSVDDRPSQSGNDRFFGGPSLQSFLQETDYVLCLLFLTILQQLYDDRLFDGGTVLA